MVRELAVNARVRRDPKGPNYGVTLPVGNQARLLTLPARSPDGVQVEVQPRVKVEADVEVEVEL